MGNQPIRLGRIFGLEISFNWSLILVFFLIAWTMATEVLPSAVPNQSSEAYWASGLVGAVVFYGCLLAHEISHALMARRKGVRVDGITLWLFGGVTQLLGEPTSAKDEALITVVGPLTSLLIAAIAFGLTAVMSSVGAPALPTNLVAWLAILNLVLGLFNLVPAIPLDGGRLLSSLIWWRTGSRQRGTHSAARVSRFFAVLVVALGLFELLTGDFISGVWLVFIGWFLFSAGSAEDRQSQMRSSFQSVPVSAVMTTPVVTVPDWLSVDQALGAVTGQLRGTICALHDQAGALSGFVCWQDLFALSSEAQRGHRLRDFARPRESFPTVSPEEALDAVIARVGPLLQRGVLVVEGGTLLGTLSSAEIGRFASGRRPSPSKSGLAA